MRMRFLCYFPVEQKTKTMHESGTYLLYFGPEIKEFLRNRHSRFPKKWWHLYSFDKDEGQDSILGCVEALCKSYGIPVCKVVYSNARINGRAIPCQYDPDTETLRFRTCCNWTTVLYGFYKYLADKYDKCGRTGEYQAIEPTYEHDGDVMNTCEVFADLYYEQLKIAVIGGTRTDNSKQRRNPPAKRQKRSPRKKNSEPEPEPELEVEPELDPTPQENPEPPLQPTPQPIPDMSREPGFVTALFAQ